MRTNISTIALFTLLVSGWAASGCSSSDDARVEVGITSNAQALATTTSAEAPAEAGAANGSLLVTITKVSVHVAGGDDDKGRDDKGAPEAEPVDDDEGGGWHVVFDGSKQVNLRDAAASEAFLAEQTIPAGKITQIRLLLADDAVVADGERSAPVTCSSCSTSGLKIVTSGKLVVPEGGKVHITLDFDQQASLSGDASGYRLSPVIHLKGDKLAACRGRVMPRPRERACDAGDLNASKNPPCALVCRAAPRRVQRCLRPRTNPGQRR